jgi:hypothetical protein
MTAPPSVAFGGIGRDEPLSKLELFSKEGLSRLVALGC